MAKQPFAIGAAVYYRPGTGTYGYEDLLLPNGCIPATVRGYGQPQTGRRAARGARVQISFYRGNTLLKRAVDAASLVLVEDVSHG